MRCHSYTTAVVVLSAVMIGSGCRASRMAASPRTSEDHTSPEVVDLDLAELDEQPGSISWSMSGYSILFGPVGQRIIDERDAEDLALLCAALATTDGQRTIVIEDHLPLRRCDYALLIAEALLSEDGPTFDLRFGPHTGYAFRDESRRIALQRLCAPDPLPVSEVYIYLVNGEDVSAEYRIGRFLP